jgi:hypothetical protein
MLYWNRKRYDMQSALGYYRDNAKHGEWIKCSQQHTLSRKIYSFGRLVKRHIYVNGKLKQIIHYDDIGATHGEYPELQMIIYYRAGLIEDVAKSE